jgi:hypothetical protein
MSAIILPGECSWFYLIELWHNHIKGFGITMNVDRRLTKGYCNPSASIQKFFHLYYGKRSQIQALERWFKNEYRSELLVLLDKKLEWIDPKSELADLSAMVKVIEERIEVAGYDEIYRVRSKHLPYKPGPYFKDIKLNPDFYLEVIAE